MPSLPVWLTAKVAIIGGAFLALLLLLGIQTARIEGFKVWPIHVRGLKAELADERAAHKQTIANYRAAAEKARAADAANKARVEADQARINQEVARDYEARLAAARATVARLRAEASAHPRGAGAAPVPGVPAPASGSAQAAGQDGFSIDDRLTATEQAIQLDELIKWVKRQHEVDVNGEPAR